MDNAEPRPSVSSAVCYKDPKTALRWLEEAFGFEPSMVILGPNDELMHSEMRFGDGIVMVGTEWSPMHKSPANDRRLQHADGARPDDHGRRRPLRTRAQGGATIAMEPTTQFYGDRTYRAVDPEGHIWTFGQTVKHMTLGRMGQGDRCEDEDPAMTVTMAQRGP